MPELIFVVEGQDSACRSTQFCLEQAGYAVRTFSTTTEAIAMAHQSRPSLVLVAAALRGARRHDLCRRVREHPLLAKTPVVLLIDVPDENSRLEGLEAGADDCVVTPFSPGELVARVQAVLRRLGRSIPTAISDPAEIVIDCAAMKLSVRGDEVTTTTLEFRLVEYLARHRGQVFTRDVLLDAVWGETQFVTPRSVDACIGRIRGKIEPDKASPTYLKTIRGVGYRFDAVAAWRTSSESCTCVACVPSIGRPRTPSTGILKKRRAAAS
jgi:DNA-binding response OmpR family regulator